MEIIDSHCHIDVADFDDDRDRVLADCRAKGVTRIVVPAVAAGGWDKLLRLCRSEEGLYAALGLHPYYLEQHQPQDIAALERRLADEPDLVAVGEIGLDYFLTELDRDKQQQLFEAQLELAQSAGLPVILHVRKAHDQVIATLKRFRLKGGIVHAFNGSLEQAKRYVEMGFMLGFGGMVSYTKATKLRRLAAELPLESIVLETDAPDMAGEAYHGQRNSPQYLPDYLEALAGLREESIEQIARQTTSNVKKVLALSA